MTLPEWLNCCDGTRQCLHRGLFFYSLKHTAGNEDLKGDNRRLKHSTGLEEWKEEIQGWKDPKSQSLLL